jgi:uncharacterized protein
VLLCYPGVQEYNTAHWAFRRLAGLLARAGFHVLRFDWSGTGDSWGETTDGTIERWTEDVTFAAHEARDASGARSVSIVGMRLGAAITTLACARGVNAARLVLWEPVVRGREYIDELESLDAREHMRLMHKVPVHREELVGFPFSHALRRSIEPIDLASSPPSGAKAVAIVSGSDRPEYRQLAAGFTRSGVAARFVHAPEDEASAQGGNREAALLGNKCLVAITDYLARGLDNHD